MIYIIIHIVFVAVFSCMYKYAALKKAHIPSSQFLMYFSAGITSLICLLAFDGIRFEPVLIRLGLCAGLLMAITTRAFFRAIEQGGLALGWVFISLSIVFPVMASIFVWEEFPSVWQMFGLGLLIPCILLFGNLDLQVEGDHKRWAFLITLSAVTTGALMIVGKTVASLPLIDVLNLKGKILITLNYLFLTFSTGSAIIALLLIREKARFKKHEIITGASMGVLNVVCNVSLLTALALLPGIVVFPIKGGFGVIATALIAVVFFKEKLTKRQMIGIVFGILCVVLVNIK